MENDIESILDEINEIVKSNSKLSAFSISNTSNITLPSVSFPSIRETNDIVCGNIMVSSMDEAMNAARIIDGKIDIILLDIERKKFKNIEYESKIRSIIKKSSVITFKPNDITVDAIDTLLSLYFDDLYQKKIVILGAGNIGSKLALKLVERDLDVTITRRNEAAAKRIVNGINTMKCRYTTSELKYNVDNVAACNKADIVIGLSFGNAIINKEIIRNMNSGGIIVDAGTGTVDPEAISLTNVKNIEIVCLSIQPAFNGFIENVFKTKLFLDQLGKRKIDDFYIISNGILGNLGDVIVDNVEKPQKIIGIADGHGKLVNYKNLTQFESNVNKVNKIIVLGN